MSSYDRKAIMTTAWRRYRLYAAYFGGQPRPFDRSLFATCLRRAWAEATPCRREAARLEQNVGFPLRSCAADRPARRVHDRHSGRLYANFAA